MVGLGLIGGSLLRHLAAHPPTEAVAAHPPVGYDADADTRAAAAAAGHQVAPTLADAVGNADLVVLATPVSTFPALLAQLAAVMPRTAVLTDVASVKVVVRDAVAAAGLDTATHRSGAGGASGAGAPTARPAPATPPVAGVPDKPAGPEVPAGSDGGSLGAAGRASRYVGGHPMAGTERSGFGASNPTLFEGAAWVLCLEDDTDLAAWLGLAELVTGLGCRVVACRAGAHDDAVARISGLPHTLAAALAATAGDGELALALAAGSFRDGTRVAGTRPDLAAALCDANRAAVADALDEALARLVAARDALRAGGSVHPLTAEGYAARLRWQARGQDGERFELDTTDPALRDRLIDLGSSGGHVEAVSDRSLRCWRPYPAANIPEP